MPAKTSKTILVIDDSPLLCKLVCQVLEPSGYMVMAATSGKEALLILERQDSTVDVIISDVIMPVINGVELMGIIHKKDPDMPVILMTAFSNMDIVLNAIKKRAFDLILKPFDDSLLRKAVERAMKHRDLLYLEKNYLKTLKETVKEQTSELQQKMAELEEARAIQTVEHENQQMIFRKVEEIKLEWERTMDCIDDIVLLVHEDGKIRRCNKALRTFTDKPYLSIIGSDWQELFLAHALISGDAAITSGSELYHAPSGSWFVFTTYPFIYGNETEVHGTVITLHDTTELKKTMEALERAYTELQTTQAQVLQNEKMASIGQLAAGVAHEINNPIGYVSSNLNTMNKYLASLTGYISSLSEIVARDPGFTGQKSLTELRQSMKIDHITNDIGSLINETLDGVGRVGKIVHDLNTFSRVDKGESCLMDLKECLESAINIVWNELKYKVTIVRNYGNTPSIKCYPQQLNQVFINLLINACHAIESKGSLTITTRVHDNSVMLSFADSGSGIAPENLNRIFEPFFTTKEVGKGTGLGLSITYDIIKKHNGDITVDSTVGKGTTFTLTLPIVDTA